MITHKVYILSYNTETLCTAKEKFQDKDWANIITINTTKYLENIMYDDWLLKNKDDWINSDYVGTLSWRSFQKIPIPDLSSENSQNLIEKNNPDVITFYHFGGNILEQATQSHGILFRSIWHYILKKIGYSTNQIFDVTIPMFFSNYWIARPEVMIDYINFFHKVKDIIENSVEMQDDFWSNANYQTYVSKRRLMEIFNRPYHPLYIFVLERLPCFFFHQRYNMLSYPYGS